MIGKLDKTIAELGAQAAQVISANQVAAALIISAAIAGGLGNAWVVGRYLEGITRQPEAASQLRTGLFLGIALVEAMPIIAVAFGILVFFGIVGGGGAH